MEFVTATILSGIAWDTIKLTGNITANYLKKSLKNYVVENLEEEDYEKLAKAINDIPEAAKKSEGKLDIFIKEDETIKEILEKANNSTKNQNIISGNTFNDSPVQQGNGNTQTINYGVPKQDK